ncbi:MAG: radical SAM protein [Pontiellaceae bacterium]|jgi:wyosine [tRNA(Phe)-imidazoG37] synthetase (radical SAM superfamily)|nr:radical SAM protein [Pontiellaceae bacterium]
MSYKYLFGPILSRRLGRSLGIDVTPFKTCSFDCIFCQCGCTTQLTAERGEFVPLTEVCAEVERWLAEDGKADCITFAGSGEPTLYSRLGELICFIKSHTALPVIVLSNGTLLYRPDVRAELLTADQVKVSLSAWDDASFQQINRPALKLSFQQVLNGERAFRRQFPGKLWLEVFLMEGINAEPEQVKKIAAAAREIRPDKIHLNTAVRPPAEAAVQPVSKEKLDHLCSLFTPCAEVIASFAAQTGSAAELSVEKLIDLIRRHPSTVAQLAQTFGVKPSVILPLLEDSRLQNEVRGGDLYYKCR